MPKSIICRYFDEIDYSDPATWSQAAKFIQGQVGGNISVVIDTDYATIDEFFEYQDETPQYPMDVGDLPHKFTVTFSIPGTYATHTEQVELYRICGDLFCEPSAPNGLSLKMAELPCENQSFPRSKRQSVPSNFAGFVPAPLLVKPHIHLKAGVGNSGAWALGESGVKLC